MNSFLETGWAIGVKVNETAIQFVDYSPGPLNPMPISWLYVAPFPPRPLFSFFDMIRYVAGLVFHATRAACVALLPGWPVAGPFRLQC
jgi:hypothetical protein